MEDSIAGHYLVQSDDDTLEIQRLKKQHTHLVKFASGGRLIRDTRINLPKNANILDSGTGSGIWLLDLARVVSPSVQLYGIDISTGLFPKTVVPNRQFLKYSVCNLPPSWSNKFHFVHQRSLIAALLQDEWPVAITELYRVLVPGMGRVQLLEPQDCAPICRGTEALPAACARFADIIRTTLAKSGHDISCSKNIPRYLAKVGFADIRVHTCSIPIGAWGGEAGRDMKEVFMAGWPKFVGAVAKYHGKETSREYLDLFAAMGRELDETASLSFIMDVIEARKLA